MDEAHTPSRQAASSKGDAVEPVKRATVGVQRFGTAEISGERYALHGPLPEATDRADILPARITKTKQIGSSRAFAAAEGGKHSTILKAAGEWQRGAQLPAAPERKLEAKTARSDTPEVVAARPTDGAIAGRLQWQRKASPFDGRRARNARVATIESGLNDRYFIIHMPPRVGGALSTGQTEYRLRGDSSRVAFTESTSRLATDTNSPSVARSMIDVAEARNWTTLRVSGHADFKRQVWLEASLRGHKTIGYEPNPGDLELLKRDREAHLVSRIEPRPGAASSNTSTAPTEKTSARSGGGRKAVLAAIEAVLVYKQVPEQQRTAVMAVAAEKLSQRLPNGQAPKIKLYDKAAPAPRPVALQPLQMPRSWERAKPSPTR
ncbi:LPD7 domain-containing protein [Roseateles sp.]|jgi:hypothetical protein|uniref:LPD7 domain-containing protein n=1 Tax=Roseateles sp. TaxID=1971397 RepID=UPI0037C6A40C